jgi:hypothetical protein
MSFLLDNLHSTRVLLVLLSLALAGASLALVYGRPSRALKETAKAVPAADAISPQATSRVPAEAELIDLRPSGFEAHEITRPQGRFLLGVNNRTGLTDLSPMLVNGSG